MDNFSFDLCFPSKHCVFSFDLCHTLNFIRKHYKSFQTEVHVIQPKNLGSNVYC